MRPSLIALLLLPLSLHAGPALTIYNSDLAVVREERAFELKAGEQTLRYSGVAARIDPTSVRLEGSGLRLLEQDYDYDLVSAERVLEKYVDQPLKALGKGGQSYEGELLAYEGGQLLLKGSGGKVLMLNRAELSSIDFPGLPGGLLTRPTLLWRLESDKAGKRDLSLSYMTGGLSWHAEYVAVLAEDEKSLGLNAWVSIDNQSGASFDKATLKLIAGDVNRAAPKAEMMLQASMRMDGGAPAPAFQERAFFDYHLYTLVWPVTLRQASVKQVELLSAVKVAVRKVYTFDAERNGPKVAVTMTLANKQAEGLGLPLPAGTWRVFKSDGAASREFIGEDKVDHTAKDETVDLKIGSAFDVVGERTVLEEKRESNGHQADRSVKIELRNRKKEAVQVKVVEHAWGRWDVDSEVWKRKNAESFETTVDLGPGEEKVLQYRVRMKY